MICPQGDPTGQSTAVAFNVVSLGFSRSQLVKSPGSSAKSWITGNGPALESKDAQVRATDLIGSKLKSPSLSPTSKVTTAAEGMVK